VGPSDFESILPRARAGEATLPRVSVNGNIRIKITIRLNGNHALSIKELAALRPIIERGVAGCLPENLAVDTVKVTRIKDADAVSKV
jgi:hypothetical protein